MNLNVEFNGNAGPEDAEAGRNWDVVQREGAAVRVFAARCTNENAKRIAECVTALSRVADPVNYVERVVDLEMTLLAAQNEADALRLKLRRAEWALEEALAFASYACSTHPELDTYCMTVVKGALDYVEEKL